MKNTFLGGYTVIEMLSVLFVLSFMSMIVITKYPDSAIKVRVSNIVSDIGGDVRESQLKASSVETAGLTVSGYGIQYASNSNLMYKGYADKSNTYEINGIWYGNWKYDGATETYKVVTLPEGFHINNACVSTTTISKPFVYCTSNTKFSDLSIVYVRPSPEPKIFVDNGTSTLYAAACLEVASDKLDDFSHSTGYVRSLVVTKTGLVSTSLGKCTK